MQRSTVKYSTLQCCSALAHYVCSEFSHLPPGSGKALKGMVDDMRLNPGEWEGKTVLFIHTGGLLGMYEKLSQLQPLFGKWNRMALP